MLRHWLLAAACLLSAEVAAAEDLASLYLDALLQRIDDNPSDGAARLEFAKREFARRRDQSAEFNARQALNTGSLTDAEADEAREILASLQRRREWIFNFDASFVPATNRQEFVDPDPDNGTDEDVVLQTVGSGVGVIGFGSVENRIKVSKDVRWSTEYFGTATVFTDPDFNAYFIAARTGPLLLQRGDDRIGVRALTEFRWLGQERDFFAVGAEAFAQRSLTDRLVGFGRVTLRQVDDSLDGQDGQTYSADGSLTRFGTDGKFERVFGAIFRADLEADNQSFWFGRVGFGVFREIGFGLGVLVEPSVSFQSFEGIDATGGIRRQDWRYGSRVRAVKRDWRLFGTSPFVSLTVLRLESNIDVFDATQTSVNAGFTRTF